MNNQFKSIYFLLQYIRMENEVNNVFNFIEKNKLPVNIIINLIDLESTMMYVYIDEKNELHITGNAYNIKIHNFLHKKIIFDIKKGVKCNNENYISKTIFLKEDLYTNFSVFLTKNEITGLCYNVREIYDEIIFQPTHNIAYVFSNNGSNIFYICKTYINKE